MGALSRAALLLAVALALPAVAQVPAVPPTDVVGDVANPVVDRARPLLEAETGENLSEEDVDVGLTLRIVNADFDVVGVLFGGGAVEMDVRATLNLSFRAVSVERLDAALEASSGDAGVSLERTFGFNSSRSVVTAEEIRLLGGGAVLAAFQEFEEEAAKDRLERALPGVAVLSVRFAWSNVVPGERARDGDPPDLRDPPIVLDARLELRFVDRTSLADLLDAYRRSKAEEEAGGRAAREKTLKERLEERQKLPPLERSAFVVLGIGQLLDLEVPPGWRLNLTLEVPKGFTIEDATDELVVSRDHRTASYYVDGGGRASALQSAGVVTISNRFLVTLVLCVAALVAGLVLRFAVEGGALAVRRKAAARRVPVSPPP